MKLKWIVFLGASGLLALLACLFSAPGGNAHYATPFAALSSVPVPEIPAKAADLVHAAAASTREQTVNEVLRDVAAIARPGVLPYVVSAICRRTPEATGSVLATAIDLQPGDVLIFTRAALCAAPDQAEQIVYSASKAEPPSCADVALVAYRQLPSASKLILAGFAGAMPGLEIYLEKAELQVGTNDCEAVIMKTAQLFNDTLKARAK
jgi:hypothetical protein